MTPPPPPTQRFQFQIPAQSGLSTDQYRPPSPSTMTHTLPLIPLPPSPHLLSRVILFPFIDHLHPLFGPFSLNINCLLNKKIKTCMHRVKYKEIITSDYLAILNRDICIYTTNKKVFNIFSKREIQTVFL